MSLDFLGKEKSFTLVAGVARYFYLVFSSNLSGDTLDVTNYTFSGSIHLEDRDVNIEIFSENLGGKLGLCIPALEAGRYPYELWAASINGERARVLYGFVGVDESLAQETPQVYENETYNVRLPEEYERWIKLEAQASSAAQLAAKQAQEAAKNIAETEKNLDVRLKQVEEVKALLLDFKNDVTNIFTVNSETGTWFVKDFNTGQKAQGDKGDPGIDGHSPFIGQSGTWFEFNDRTQEYEDTQTRAVGRDGIDGNKIQYVKIDAYEDLAAIPDNKRTGFLYYIEGEPPALYSWMATAEGGEWVNIGNVTQVATSRIHGLVKLGTDVVINGGAPVGVGANGEMRVGVGSTVEAGMYRLSYTGSCESCVGLTPGGALGVPFASLNQAGVVKTGSAFESNNPTPYLLSTGITRKHELANNLVYGGAIKHASPTYWRNNCPELATNIPDEYFNERFYLGLHTSPQLPQTDGVLQVASALNTGDLVGGVHLTEHLDDEREDAVVSAAKTKEAIETLLDSDEMKRKIADIVAEQVERSSASGFSVGDIKTTFTSKTPAGFLPLRGGTFLRSEYKNLYDFLISEGIIDASSGDGVSTFKVPDARGCFLRNCDEGRGLDSAGTRKAASYQKSYAQQFDQIRAYAENTLVWNQGYGSIRGNGNIGIAIVNTGNANGVYAGLDNSYYASGSNPRFWHIKSFPAGCANPQNATWQSDTRPHNIAVYSYIKY